MKLFNAILDLIIEIIEKNKIISSLSLIFIIWMFYPNSVTLGPGVKVLYPPTQTSSEVSNFEYKGYTIIPLYKMSLEAKILSKNNYNDSTSDLVPLDLALGWQNMSDENVLENISITQRGRWYYWSIPGFENISRNEIETQSSNWHIIPNSEELKDKIKSFKKGSIIYLEGYLVNFTGKQSRNSSTTRNDTGNGACEIMYVEDAYITE